MTKKAPRKKYYIQPEDLRTEISNFKETGEASERLGEMLIQIATGLAASSKFDQRTYRDDMASDAVLRMYKNLDLIDTTDPLDLSACCVRDYNRNAIIKYSSTPITTEFRAAAKPCTAGFKKCIIESYDINNPDVCDISIVKIVKKKEKNEDGEIEEWEDIVTIDSMSDVPLTHILFKKTNPFSYLTMIAYRVYLGRCDKENKQDKAIDMYREECYSEFESTECISNRSPNEGDMDMGFDYVNCEEVDKDK